MGNRTEFKGEPVKFEETLHVEEGVTCDVYSFVGTDVKDLGIVKVKSGHKTPLQLVVGGDKTIEVFSKGKGVLTVTDKDGNKHIYEFPDEPQTAIEVKVGEKMQWEAQEDLEFYEICYPPYSDGRYESLPE